MWYFNNLMDEQKYKEDKQYLTFILHGVIFQSSMHYETANIKPQMCFNILTSFRHWFNFVSSGTVSWKWTADSRNVVYCISRFTKSQSWTTVAIFCFTRLSVIHFSCSSANWSPIHQTLFHEIWAVDNFFFKGLNT